MSKLSKVFAGAAVASIGLSIAVYYNVDQMTGVFVGLWPFNTCQFCKSSKII